MSKKSRTDRSARDRILETSSRLFYRRGYKAVGIDTIIAETGIAKMTLYRHFRSKDDLIAASLERTNEGFWQWLEEEIAKQHTPRGKLQAIFGAIQKLATSHRCLGCAFQGAAAEFPLLEHPGHKAALAHKKQVLERFAELARQAGLHEPESLAAKLLLLMDGAWVAARMFGPESPATELAEAAAWLIEQHVADRGGPQGSIGPGQEKAG